MRYRLSQLATICYGKNQKKVLSPDGRFPIYGTGGLMGMASEPLYAHESVLIGRKGTIDKVRYVNRPFWTVDTLFYTKINEQVILPYYLYCLLQTVDLLKLNEGTTIPSLRTDTLNKLEFEVPSLATQKKITKMLFDIDRKIELNRRINGCLEAQADMLYRKLFLLDQSDLREVSLAELMDYAGGSQPPASEFLNHPEPGYVRFVQIRDYQGDDHVTFIPISPRNKLCEEKDIMIARYGASLGRICFGLNGAYNVALAKVFPKKPYYREFLRCYLSSQAFYEGINGRGGRSAQAGFNASDIASFKLRIPKDESVIKLFESHAATLFNIRLANLKQNERLGRMRDSLLPKLMSGEIGVDSIKVD